MKTVKAKLSEDLSKAVEEKAEVQIELPRQGQADYSSNLAFKLPGKPLENAEKIKNKFRSDLVEKVEVAKPGFLNFFLKKEFLQQQVGEILEQGNKFGSLDTGKGKKARVEFVSANPTGPLHIGNARGGPLGDVMASVLEKAGYQVLREYLHNDVGGQVKTLGESIKTLLHGEKPAEGHYTGEYLKELAEEIEKEEEEAPLEIEAETLGRRAVEILFEEIIRDCEAMGVKFDKIFKESELQKEAEGVIAELKNKGFVKEKDGALWFSPRLSSKRAPSLRSSAPSDEFDRESVVKKSNGEYTYFSSDIVYHKKKFEGYDVVIDVLGSNHSGHVPRLESVIKALGEDVSKFRCILYQYVRVKRGDEVLKMSKRAGNFVTAREVLDEVGKDAFRFFLLRNSHNTHIDFDIEEAKKKAKENPVFYVQYAHSRIVSVLSKAEGRSFDTRDFGLLKEEEELNLIKKLIQFPEVLEGTVLSLEPHRLTHYAVDLADSFHKFYEKQKVLSEDEELTKAMLGLISATQIVLKEILRLLGISAPDRM